MPNTQFSAFKCPIVIAGNENGTGIEMSGEMGIELGIGRG